MPLFKRDGLEFRLVEDRDLEAIARLRNDASTWTQLGDPRPVKIGRQKAWLEAVNASADKIYLTIETAGRFMGLVRMDEYDPVNRSLRVGVDVVPDERGHGIGREAFLALEEYAFNELNINRLWLLVLDLNIVARKLYLSRGFKVEGKMRQAVFRSGRYRDYVVMSLLREEWK